MQKPDTVIPLRSHQHWVYQNNLLCYLNHDLPANIFPKHFTLLWHYCIIGLYFSFYPEAALDSFCCITDRWSFFILLLCMWFLLHNVVSPALLHWIYRADCGPWFQFVKTGRVLHSTCPLYQLVLTHKFCNHILLSAIQVLNYNIK